MIIRRYCKRRIRRVLINSLKLTSRALHLKLAELDRYSSFLKFGHKFRGN